MPEPERLRTLSDVAFLTGLAQRGRWQRTPAGPIVAPLCVLFQFAKVVHPCDNGLNFQVSWITSMADHPKKRDPQRKSSEHRTNARYRLSSPPEVEIVPAESGTPTKVRLGDLSRGGCYVESDRELPLGIEVTVTLKKNGDQVRAQARVVRAVPKKGFALEFTSMEGEDFRILESWLSIFVATTWVAANRRRTDRVAMQIEVRVSGYDGEGARFKEDTRTVVISAFGCLVILRAPVKVGQRLVLSNLTTKATVECMVAYRGNAGQVGLAFTVLNQPFWPMDFPSAEWSPDNPDTKRFGS